MKRLNYKHASMVFLCLLVVMAFMGVAYAALSTTLKISFGKITQSVQSWDVGFDTTVNGSSIAGVAVGQNVSAIKCGTATVTRNTISGIKITFSNPGDICWYPISVSNKGTIDAIISKTSFTKPTNTSCSSYSAQIAVCGDITYKLHYDTYTSSTLVYPNQNPLAAGASRVIVLTAEYTGSTAASDDFTHSGMSWSLQYTQK